MININEIAVQDHERNLGKTFILSVNVKCQK